jgi:D-hydroxyproline dehydrogenase subunit alpha
VLVVGAGPAGVAAAAEASRHGLDVVLVDARARAGGQYYARRGLGDDPFAGLPARATAGLDRAKVAFWGRTEVWGAFDGTFAVTSNGTSRAVEADAVVLATGAVERPQPFPGWDDASVLTAGAAQLLLKEQSVVLPGDVVVAGSGPFLVAVASGLSRAGARVTALVEATPRLPLARGLWPLLFDPAYGAEGIALAWGIRGMRKLFGLRVAAKEPGRVVLSDGRTVACDALCVGGGFLPRLSLAALLGCSVGQDGVVVDPDQRTSRPTVFAAGEVTGVAGSRVAEVEGRLAGLAVVVDRLGSLPPESRRRRRRLLARRTRLRRAAARLLGAYDPIDPLALATDDTIICRCEGVTLRQVRDARLGAPPAEGTRALKALLRCGMGPCQGLFCRDALAAVLGGAGDDGVEVRTRPPLAPVTVGEVARLGGLGPDVEPEEC